MKPIIRNFLNIIRRYKLAVALNILGLSFDFVEGSAKYNILKKLKKNDFFSKFCNLFL